MPRQPLPIRVGPDTPAKLEAAAARRYAEARRLALDGERLGALYLYGYSIEMRLKAAYYQLAGVPRHWDIEQPRPGSTQSPRKIAQLAIQVQLPPPPAKQPLGHYLPGWARLVIDTRVGHALGPLAAALANDLWNQVQTAARSWKESLRYHANKPYDEELDEVVAAARWFQLNYRRFWN